MHIKQVYNTYKLTSLTSSVKADEVSRLLCHLVTIIIVFCSQADSLYHSTNAFLHLDNIQSHIQSQKVGNMLKMLVVFVGCLCYTVNFMIVWKSRGHAALCLVKERRVGYKKSLNFHTRHEGSGLQTSHYTRSCCPTESKWIYITCHMYLHTYSTTIQIADEP